MRLQEEGYGKKISGCGVGGYVEEWMIVVPFAVGKTTTISTKHAS
jgi:hypothetical protein